MAMDVCKKNQIQKIVVGAQHITSAYKCFSFVSLRCCCTYSPPGGGSESEKFCNPLSPKIHIHILQTQLHTFLLRLFERIWFKIKVFSFGNIFSNSGWVELCFREDFKLYLIELFRIQLLMSSVSSSICIHKI